MINFWTTARVATGVQLLLENLIWQTIQMGSNKIGGGVVFAFQTITTEHHFKFFIYFKFENFY